MLEHFVKEGFLNPWLNLERLNNDLGLLLQNRLSGNQSGLAVFENDDRVILRGDFPGLKAEDLDITAQENALVIRGERKEPAISESDVFLRRERACGPFTRTFTLPFSIDAERIKASYNQGVLEIEIARPDEVKPKKISIKVN